jgi:hypothetical protein
MSSPPFVSLFSFRWIGLGLYNLGILPSSNPFGDPVLYTSLYILTGTIFFLYSDLHIRAGTSGTCYRPEASIAVLFVRIERLLSFIPVVYQADVLNKKESRGGSFFLRLVAGVHQR